MPRPSVTVTHSSAIVACTVSAVLVVTLALGMPPASAADDVAAEPGNPVEPATQEASDARTILSPESLDSGQHMAWVWFHQVERFAVQEGQWQQVERRAGAHGEPSRLFAPDPPRVLVCELGICLLLWMPPEALSWVVTRPVTVRDEGAVQVRLLPGAPVLRGEDGAFSAQPNFVLPVETGEVPAEVVGRTFERSMTFPGAHDHAVTPPMGMWGSPAEVGGDQPPVMMLGPGVSAWAIRATIQERAEGADGEACRATLLTEWREVEGWMPCAALRPQEPFGMARVGGVAVMGDNVVMLSRHALLYGTPGGEEVGRVVDSGVRARRLQEDESGWVQVRVPGPLGQVEVWLAPSEAE